MVMFMKDDDSLKDLVRLANDMFDQNQATPKCLIPDEPTDTQDMLIKLFHNAEDFQRYAHRWLKMATNLSPSTEQDGMNLQAASAMLHFAENVMQECDTRIREIEDNV